MNQKKQLGNNFFTFFILFNLIALPILFFVGKQADLLKDIMAEKKLLVYGSIRPFELTTQASKPFGSKEMQGRIWVANFMFTSCPNQCPAMNFKMSLLQEPLRSKNVGFLSFSVDPQKDSPVVLREYAERFKARPGLWYFLTGPKNTIGQLLEDCHFAKAADPLLHGLRLVLIDKNGQIRGYYDYTDEAMVKKMTKDINLLRWGG